MSRSDRAALFVAALLGTWVNLILNLIVWGGLYLFHLIPYDAETFWLSLWPILVDIAILMATMALTRQQLKQQEALEVALQALHLLMQDQKAGDERHEEVLLQIQGIGKHNAKDIDDIREDVHAVQRQMVRIIQWIDRQEGI